MTLTLLREYMKLRTGTCPQYVYTASDDFIEAGCSSTRLGAHWVYIPDVNVLRHDCKGKSLIAALVGDPILRCCICEEVLPEHLHFVLEVAKVEYERHGT